MEHTGHVRIDRKDIPYHLLDDKVVLMSHNTYSMLFPSEVKNKKVSENEIWKNTMDITHRETV